MIWSAEQEPNENTRYNHVLCNTPLGVASIEWKGWKDYDSRGVYLDGEYIASCQSTDDGKEEIRLYLTNKTLELIGFLGSTKEQTND